MKPPFMSIEEYAKERGACYAGAVNGYVQEEIIKSYLIGHEEGFDEATRASINVIENISYFAPKVTPNKTDKQTEV